MTLPRQRGTHATPLVQPVTITELIPSNDPDVPGFAECLDAFRITRKLPLLRRGKGALPAVGDVWLIDRSMGDWTFATCVRAALTTVEGNVIEGSAQDALLSAMAALGFVIDDATRVEGGDAENPQPWAYWMGLNP